MTRRKLAQLREEIERLRLARDVKSRKVVQLARQIGRKRYNKKGKEPTYTHPELTNRPPLSIPNHPTLAVGTKNSILDDLILDLDEYEERLDQEIVERNGHR
jgi:hypothetical protein